MKHLVLVVSLAMLTIPGEAAVVSEHVFGGTGEEAVRDVLALPDGGLLLAGSVTSPSTNGNRTAAGFGGRDLWLMRLDAQARPIWDAAYGGSDTDELRRVLPVHSGGFLLLGSSLSAAGGTRTAAPLGGADAWVTLVNQQGTPLWDRAFGGDGGEQFLHGIELTDGGFLLVGTSASEPGPGKSSVLHGESDGWLVRLDAQGNRLWDRTFGGTFTDELHAILAAPDGGCYVAGLSDSRPQTGNKTSPAYGFRDVWVLHLNSEGGIIWENSLGGAADDWATDLVRTADGGLLVVGNSLSRAGGTKTSPAFGTDFFTPDGWFLRVDEQGIPIWDFSFGASDTDEAQALVQLPDGNYFLAGRGWEGTNGTRTLPGYGGEDGYAVRLASDEGRLLAVSQTNAEMAQDGFRFTLGGQSSLWYRIERSPDLINWGRLSTHQAGEIPLSLIDAEATNVLRRFYRARLIPAP